MTKPLWKELVDDALRMPEHEIEMLRQERIVGIACEGDLAPLIKYLKEQPATPLTSFLVGFMEKKIRLPKHRPSKSLDRHRRVTTFVLCMRRLGASPTEAEDEARTEFNYADGRNIRDIVKAHKDDPIVGAYAHGTLQGQTDLTRTVALAFERVAGKSAKGRKRVRTA
jgi:hypothetical protein